MASRYFSLLSLALLVLLSVSSANAKKKSPVEFLKHVQGCHKGDKVEGILQLKKYLQQFGYLDYKNRTHANDDDFDELLESAVKTYQLNFHVKPTGVLDRKTLSKMAMPRCGVADIVNGTNLMRSHHHHHGSGFHAVAHYSFFSGNTRSDAMEPVARAFQTWQANTHFSFSRVEDSGNAHITIGFESGDHGDRFPFDGPSPSGPTIAHAFAPTDGRFHYDAEEKWAVGAVPGSIDMETVALHEIGHLLGLDHSEVEGAIMWPVLPTGSTKGLHTDDIDGIRALYQV
ncbi:hypothetical protein EZV62_007872 [Acer yangbiense]|uniref:Peptidase metallopeptidase domain-containing protein n=1 Tax=Acer yangbiense TaxID=1000413 RepID=A0A5C7IBK8_9ROSI|nr:hypothetical protein EZV62_007872 [Acer yangbiense]